VCYGRESLTHEQLRAAACGWAARLRDRGAMPEDRVGLFSENSPFFIAAYLGAICAGACAVPCPVDCNDPMLRRIISATAMKRMLVSARFEPRVRALAESLGVEVIGESACRTGPTECRAVSVDPLRHLAAIMFTSGSTGEAKGVMVTHRNVACNTQDIIEYMGLTADDRAMVVLPFYYCYGTSLLHAVLASGGCLVLNNRFMFPEKMLDEMEQQRCTGLAGVPATYQILLRKTRFAQRRFPTLRWLQQAGGKLANPFIREIRQALPAVRFFTMYGQTEATARLSYLPPERLDDKMGSIGKGLPHARLEVLHPDGTPVRPGSDEVGEIVASGDSITLGYWNDPDETSRYFRHGKLYTGDMARLDDDGFIYIVERARDFIKAMGNRVGPKEVEEVIAELPQVVEAAVIGVPDEMWGEAIKAFIVTVSPGQLTRDDVRNHCLKRLPNYKIPEHVEFLSRLPKTGNGKVDKVALKGLRRPEEAADVL